MESDRYLEPALAELIEKHARVLHDAGTPAADLAAVLWQAAEELHRLHAELSHRRHTWGSDPIWVIRDHLPKDVADSVT